MSDDLDYWGQPDGIGPLPHPKAGGRAADAYRRLGVVWLGRAGGPSPSHVRRAYRRHPNIRRLAGVTREEVA